LAIIVSASAISGIVWRGVVIYRRRRQDRVSRGTTGPGADRDEIVEVLNEVFAGTAEIKGFPTADPQLQRDPERPDYPVDERVSREADRIRPALDRVHRNEPHGLLVVDPAWQDGAYLLPYQIADYATICVLREAGASLPPIITANAVLCCPANNEIYLLRRDAGVDTYPRHLHIFGGNLTAEGKRFHDDSLRAAAVRELLEETSLSLSIPDDTYRVAALELSPDHTRDFFQLTYLAVAISPALAEDIRGHEEGHVLTKSLAELEEALLRTDETWVPSAKMHLLLWLALGAPTSGDRAHFDPRKAHGVYELWRQTIATRRQDQSPGAHPRDSAPGR
jgi:hypothetical protein